MEDFKKRAAGLGVELGTKEIERFEILLSELKGWNKETNLTGITTDKEIILKHFLDSLTLLPHIGPKITSILDVGTGAGFPGLPLKIVRREVTLGLLEATKKKTDFLEHVVKKLDLADVKIINSRAEDAGQNLRFRESFDVVVSRAVADLKILAEYCLPFLKFGGIFIAQKMANQDEIESAKISIKTLGGSISNIVPIKVPDLEERQLIIIEKIGPTPEKYPRRPGMPEKKPLC